MARNKRYALIYLQPIGYVLACVALLAMIDWSVNFGLEKWRLLSLTREAGHGLARLEQEITGLEIETLQLANSLSSLQSQTLPNLDDIKRLSGSHRLAVSGVDKASASVRSSNPNRETYRIVLSGTVGQAIRFLRELESTYLFDPRTVILTPVDNQGSRVYLDITLSTAIK